MRKKTILKRLMSVTVAMVIALVFSMGGSVAQAKNPIIFADFGWDSVQVHNRIAAVVIEHGLGYTVQYVQGETIMLNTALIEARGSQAPNINMETWTENWQELYDKGKKTGNGSQLGQRLCGTGSQFPQQRPGILGTHLRD
jgi:glycine betaine/proline transport system substrate-binding protein